MRIALLHFALAKGPEHKNREILKKGVQMAASSGADWIVTPETALQGYFFYKNNPEEKILEAGNSLFGDFLSLAKIYGVSLFLSSAEHDARDGKNYNSCFVLYEDGKCIGRHRKLFSHQSGAEGWMEIGHEVEVFPLQGENVAVLVCADSYYEEAARKVREKSASLVIVPAAWPPGPCCHQPWKVWETCSLRTQTPVIVCNQTGYGMAQMYGMDMEQAQSAVILEGHVLFSYSGKPAILLFDWDETSHKPISSAFQVIEYNES